MGRVRDFFDKVSLAKIQGSLKAEQAGVFNLKYDLKYERHTFNIQGLDSEQIKRFIETKITPELENKIIERVEQKLAPVIDVIDKLSDSTVGEVVVGSTLLVSGEVMDKDFK